MELQALLHELVRGQERGVGPLSQEEMRAARIRYFSPHPAVNPHPAPEVP